MLEQMMEVYHVGGCIRKELLGLKPVDIDYVVPDNGNATVNNLQHARLRVIRSFKKNYGEIFK